jgi:hypothetical protein
MRREAMRDEIHYGVPAEVTGITNTRAVVEGNEGFEGDCGGDGDGWDKDLAGYPSAPHEAVHMKGAIGLL